MDFKPIIALLIVGALAAILLHKNNVSKRLLESERGKVEQLSKALERSKEAELALSSHNAKLQKEKEKNEQSISKIKEGLSHSECLTLPDSVIRLLNNAERGGAN